ncbi:hypothetical protein [Sphingomonas colocasiae]|uniref:Carboxypeptidase regulatory-like domain-containing protein n=1 Tax=Sphingomonas colocasiae TaxID=1848973 RepID=A0ABS7PQ38_9SPHN|nr:hypothetical protein [Sphingomonas colocasiae]MBY8823338.1 hypothetical protein [Sphingomonas colocasiae]
MLKYLPPALFVASGAALSQEPALPPFKSADVSWATVKGRGVLTGSAIDRIDGTETNCADMPVNLVPRSAYADARMKAIYGTIEAGSKPNAEIPTLPSNPDYQASQLKVNCDRDGRFKFSGLAAGTYYLSTFILLNGPGICGPWQVSRGHAPGHCRRR